MNKTIKIYNGNYEATCYNGDYIELFCPEMMDTIFVNKQDLLDMLKMFEEQEQENK